MTARWVYRFPWHTAIFMVSCSLARVPLWFAAIGLLMDLATKVPGRKTTEKSLIHALYIGLAGIPAAFLSSVMVWYVGPTMDACTLNEAFPALWLKVASHFCQQGQPALADKYVSAFAVHWALMPMVAVAVAYVGGGTSNSEKDSTKKLALL